MVRKKRGKPIKKNINIDDNKGNGVGKNDDNNENNQLLKKTKSQPCQELMSSPTKRSSRISCIKSISPLPSSSSINLKQSREKTHENQECIQNGSTNSEHSQREMSGESSFYPKVSSEKSDELSKSEDTLLVQNNNVHKETINSKDFNYQNNIEHIKTATTEITNKSIKMEGKVIKDTLASIEKNNTFLKEDVHNVEHKESHDGKDADAHKSGIVNKIKRSKSSSNDDNLNRNQLEFTNNFGLTSIESNNSLEKKLNTVNNIEEQKDTLLLINKNKLNDSYLVKPRKEDKNITTKEEKNITIVGSSNTLETSGQLSNSSSLDKSKHIPGISYILITITKNSSGGKSSLLYDCVLCNLEKKGNFEGAEMKTHIKSRSHLMNVLEIDNHELFKKYKCDNTVPESTLFKEVCFQNCHSALKTQDAKPSLRTRVTTPATYVAKRKALVKKISSLRSTSRKPSDSKCVSSSTISETKSDKSNLQNTQKVNQEIIPKLISDSMINDVQSFLEKLAEKQKERRPKNIVLAMDDRIVNLNTEEFDGRVKVVRSIRLNHDTVIETLKSNNLLGKDSLIIVVCGIYSFVRANIFNICNKMKCLDPIVKYMINTDTCSDKLISKALHLHEYILNNTTNDKVLFCDMIPLKICNGQCKKCDNCHISLVDIPHNIYSKYLKTIDEYNAFVDNHTRIIGSKPWQLLANSFPSKDSIASPLNYKYDYTKMDDKRASEIVTKNVREILNSLKLIKTESFFSADPKMDLMEPEERDYLHLTFAALVNTLVRKQQNRSPNQIMFLMDYDFLNLKIEQFGNDVILRRIKEFKKATICLKEFSGKDLLVVALFGRDLLVSKEYVGVCKKYNCPNPLIKYTINSNITSHILISKAIVFHDLVLKFKPNSKVLLTGLTPQHFCIGAINSCKNGHQIHNETTEQQYYNYLNIIKNYNDFVKYHSQLMGYKYWDLLGNSYPVKDDNITTCKNCSNYDYSNVDNKLISEYILRNTRELLQSLKPQKEISSQISTILNKELTSQKISISTVASSQSLAENLVQKQRERCPKRIVFVTDNVDLKWKRKDFDGFTRLIKVSKLNLENAYNILKNNNLLGKGSTFVIMCGIYSLIRKIDVAICKQAKCLNPLIKYSVIPRVTGEALISKALSFQQHILDETSNDQVMFCHIIPITIISDSNCKNNHKEKNVIHKDVHSLYMKAIEEYNHFVDQHCQMFGFKNFDLFKNTITNDGSSTFDYSNIDKNLLSDNILKGIQKLCENKRKKEEHLVSARDVLTSVDEPPRKHLKSSNTELSTKETNNLHSGLNTKEGPHVFEKVVLLMSESYAKRLNRFSEDNINVLVTKSSKFIDIVSEILSESKLHSQSTLYLLHTDIYGIAHTDKFKGCFCALSPLSVIVPDKENLVQCFGIIETLEKSLQSLATEVNSQLNPGSAFCFLPPLPPTLVDVNCRSDHTVFHDLVLKNMEIEYFLATYKDITHFKSSFTRYSKSLISLSLAVFSQLGINKKAFENYCNVTSIWNHHITHVTYGNIIHSDRECFRKYRTWMIAVTSFINDCTLHQEEPVIVETPLTIKKIENQQCDLTSTVTTQICLGKHSNIPTNIVSESKLNKTEVENDSSTHREENLLTMKITNQQHNITNVSNTEHSFENNSNIVSKSNKIVKVNNCTNSQEEFVETPSAIEKMITSLQHYEPTLITSQHQATISTNVISEPKFAKTGTVVKKSNDVNGDVYDHIVFISWDQKLFKRLRVVEEGNLKIISFISLDSSCEWNDLKKNLDSIKSLASCSNILFVICGSVNLFTNEYNLMSCMRMKCNKSLSYLTSSTLSENKLASRAKKINQIVTKIKKHFSNRSDVFLIPFSMLCAERKVYDHDKLHSLFLSNDSAYLVLGERDRWDTAAKQMKILWQRDELFINAEKNFKSMIPSLLSLSEKTSFVHWIDLEKFPRDTESEYITTCQTFLRKLLTIANPSANLKFLPCTESGNSDICALYQNSNTISDSEILDTNSVNLHSLKKNDANTTANLKSTNSNNSEICVLYKNIKTISDSNKNSGNLNSLKKDNNTSNIQATVEEVAVYKDSEDNFPKFVLDFLNVEKRNNNIPFEHIYIIGKKELSSLLIMTDLENVKFIQCHQSEVTEKEIPTLIKKIGDLKSNSACFLSLDLLFFAEAKNVSSGCKQFRCETRIPVMNLDVDEDADIIAVNSYLLGKIMDLISFVTKLSLFIPVIMMPIFPSRIFCKDDFLDTNHKLVHSINKPDSYVVEGKKKKWETFGNIASTLWMNVMKSNNEKYFLAEDFLKFIKESYKCLTIEDNVSKYSSPCSDILKWGHILDIFLQILVVDASEQKKDSVSSEDVTIAIDLSTAQDENSNPIAEILDLIMPAEIKSEQTKQTSIAVKTSNLITVSENSPLRTQTNIDKGKENTNQSSTNTEKLDRTSKNTEDLMKNQIPTLISGLVEKSNRSMKGAQESKLALNKTIIVTNKKVITKPVNIVQEVKNSNPLAKDSNDSKVDKNSKSNQSGKEADDKKNKVVSNQVEKSNQSTKEPENLSQILKKTKSAEKRARIKARNARNKSTANGANLTSEKLSTIPMDKPISTIESISEKLRNNNCLVSTPAINHKVLNFYVIIWNSLPWNEEKIINTFKEMEINALGHMYDDHHLVDIFNGKKEEIDKTVSLLKKLDERMRICVIEEKEFFDLNYKTLKCDGSCNVDQENCCYYHDRKDQRRPPIEGNSFNYNSILCQFALSTYGCKKGERCTCSHNRFEINFHPTTYQSSLCPDGRIDLCQRQPWCSNAHKYTPEMIYNSDWEDLVTFGPENSLKYIIGAIRGFHKAATLREKKVIFISPSLKFLNIVKSVILSLMKESKIRIILVGDSSVDSDNYDVFLGTLENIANHNWNLITRKDVRALIVDDVMTLMNKPDAKLLLISIMEKLKDNSVINKIFVSEIYDPKDTDYLSAGLGIPLKHENYTLTSIVAPEVRKVSVRSEIHKLPLSLSISPSERELQQAESQIERSHMVSFLYSLSKTPREKSPSNATCEKSPTIKSEVEKSPVGSRLKTERKREFSVSRSNTTREKSPTLKSRLPSKDNSLSLPEAKKSPVGSRLNTERKRKLSGSQSNATREKSPTHKSRLSSKDNSLSLPEAKKSPVGPRLKTERKRKLSGSRSNATREKSPAHKSRLSSKDNSLSLSEAKKSPVRPRLKTERKQKLSGSRSNATREKSSTHKSRLSSKDNSLSLPEAKKSPVGPRLKTERKRKFSASQTRKSLRRKDRSRSRSRSYTEYSENKSLSKSPVKRRRLNFSHHKSRRERSRSKSPVSRSLSKSPIQRSRLNLKKQRSHPKDISQPKSDHQSISSSYNHMSSKASISTSQDSIPSSSLNLSIKDNQKFSIDQTITILEQISSKLGMLGPAMAEIVRCARNFGVDSSDTLKLFTDEENVILLKMVVDKLKSMLPSASPSDLPVFAMAVTFIVKLLDYVKNLPYPEVKLNLRAIAIASKNKNSPFTLNLIKTAFAYEGKQNPTIAEINEAFLQVRSLHFEMTLEEN